MSFFLHPSYSAVVTEHFWKLYKVCPLSLCSFVTTTTTTHTVALQSLHKIYYWPQCELFLGIHTATHPYTPKSLQGPGLTGEKFSVASAPSYTPPPAVTCTFSTTTDLPGHVELKAHLTPPVVLLHPLCVNKDIQPGWCSRNTCCHTGPWVVVEQLHFLLTFRPRSHSPPNVHSLITISSACLAS